MKNTIKSEKYSAGQRLIAAGFLVYIIWGHFWAVCRLVGQPFDPYLALFGVVLGGLPLGLGAGLELWRFWTSLRST